MVIPPCGGNDSSTSTTFLMACKHKMYHIGVLTKLFQHASDLAVGGHHNGYG